MKIRFEQYEQQTINGNPAPIDALEIAGSGERGRAEKNQFLVDLKSSDNSAAYGFKGIKKDSKKSIAEMVSPCRSVFQHNCISDRHKCPHDRHPV